MAGRTEGYWGDERLLRRRLDRADFLRLIGAGATLPFIPASLAALGARPGEAQTVPTPADLVAGGEFPIGAWWPPPPPARTDPNPDQTARQQYQEIAAANFNFVIGGNGVTNDRSIPIALNAAAANDLKFLLTDDPGNTTGLQDLIRGGTASSASAQDTQSSEPGVMRYMNEQDDPASAPDGTVSNLALSDVQQRIRDRVTYLRNTYASTTDPSANYPALAGINLFDEPSRSMFGRLKFAKTEVREQFPDDRDLPYANLYPSYAARSALGTRTYADYLDLYLKGVRPALLCFDHYPLLTQDRLTSDYFSNWAAIRNRALKYRIPSWIFIQSVGFEGSVISPPRRRPKDISDLYWQVNVSLAYGAKGIQYFTYWTPRSDPPRIQFKDALVSEDGTLTQLYYDATDVNEYLSKVGKQLLPLTSELVMHTGVKKAKPGVRPFKADGWLRAAGGSPVILGRFFRTSLQDAERYLLVVNRSLDNVANIRLTVSDSVRRVFKFDPASTAQNPYTEVPLGTSPRSFQVGPLGAGEAELYRLSRVAT